MRHVVLAAVLLFVTSAVSADDIRVLKLEQDVHNLERVVQDLSRQIAQLELQLAMVSGGARLAVPVPPVRDAAWLDGNNWSRIQPGMTEKEVVTILGAPTSAREEEGARVLFYAMEVGQEAILAGRVRLRDGRVTDIEPPRLR